VAGRPAHRCPARQPPRAGGDRGHRHPADRRFQRGGELHRELLHGERGPVGGLRSAQPPLRPSPAPVPGVLRQPPARHHPLDRHRRREDHPGLRLLGDPGHPGRSADHRRDARHHVLAQLGLCPDRGGGNALPADVRHALQRGGQARDPRGAPPSERHHGRGAAGTGVGAGGEGLRDPGHRAGAADGCEPRRRGCGPGGPPGQIPDLASGVGHRRPLYRLRPLSRHRPGLGGRHDPG
jgi:hypothetical protein